jgi:hypothetical protein
MAKNWSQIIGNSATMWSIPVPTVHYLTALPDAQNYTTRPPPVATAHCKEAMKTMETHMRDLKKRYLYVPPLQDSD